MSAHTEHAIYSAIARVVREGVWSHMPDVSAIAVSLRAICSVWAGIIFFLFLHLQFSGRPFRLGVISARAGLVGAAAVSGAPIQDSSFLKNTPI